MGMLVEATQGKTVKDGNGDKWTLHADVYRTMEHPLVPQHADDEREIESELLNHPTNVWVNNRTGMAHENDMLHHIDSGTSEPHSHHGAVPMYHCTHYCQHNEEE